jgi:hypothetical protein
MEHLSSHWMGFLEISYLGIFQNLNGFGDEVEEKRADV